MADLGLTTPATQRRMRQRGPALKVRRYGRNDFEKFNEETARGSHLRVGHGSVGKVDIDCKYHWSKAQWGTVGSNPAGIVYMDITFKQPHGCWLERASVYVTLSEDTACYALDAPRRSSESSRRSPRSLESDYAVQIREYYGPSCIIGPKTTAEKTVSKSVKPSIGATGVGEVSGMGRESGLSMEVSDRWVFRGTRCRPGSGDGIRTLEWEFKENQMDPSQVHNREYHTAFAFEHSQRPVFMRVEVEGELSSKRQKLKHKVATFSSNFGKEDKSTLTHMDFNKAQGLEKSLDQIARGLDMAMQYENSRHLAVEMPGPMVAKFSQDGLLPVDGEEETGSDEVREPDEPGRLEEGSKDEALLRALRRQLDGRPPTSTKPSAEANWLEKKGPEPTAIVHDPMEQEPAGTVNDPAQQELFKVPILIFIKLLAIMTQWFGRPIPRFSPRLPSAPSPHAK